MYKDECNWPRTNRLASRGTVQAIGIQPRAWITFCLQNAEAQGADMKAQAHGEHARQTGLPYIPGTTAPPGGDRKREKKGKR